ncbi:signal peptidase I [Streptococcus sp. X16XC17]|uniref:signal peptidase I n=1 Tax=unclassified Streptococcus TaxID=2608887 RepID=UPI00066FB60F|nr:MULTISPECIES: signal peptidase I [unclassified Streptococcus]TCD46243.1 signal peptidase I [Streptococcus sp. X16XC17]
MVKRDLIRQIVFTILLVVGIIGLRIWFFEPVTINEQMANDYFEKDQLILAIKNDNLTYGDFVLYEEEGQRYVGRIIALEGDKVTYMDDVLYRNDLIVEEAYLDRPRHQEYFTEDLTISTITKGKSDVVTPHAYLVLNDVRTDKRDSREFGLITQDQIIGRMAFRVTPLKKFGFIEIGLAK